MTDMHSSFEEGCHEDETEPVADQERWTGR